MFFDRVPKRTSWQGRLTLGAATICAWHHSVSKLSARQITVTRIDGRPAIGASVRLREEQAGLPQETQTDSKSFIADNQGKASVELQRAPVGDALIEATLIEGQRGFYGRVRYADMKSGKAAIQLQSGWLIQGRVLLNGQPVADAKLGISTGVPTPRTAGIVFVPASTWTTFDIVRANSDGRYRIAVPADKVYGVGLYEAAGYPNDLFSVFGEGRPNSEGVTNIRDFSLQLGTEEISGVIVDENDVPIEGLSVGIERVETGCFIGYNESEFLTDVAGRFTLRSLPTGAYKLLIFYAAKDNPNNPGQRIGREPARAQATAGDKDLRIKISRF